MIYATETVTNTTADDFEAALNAAIEQWQRNRLRVEVQFSTSTESRPGHVDAHRVRFSAMIIAHRPESHDG